MELELIRPDDWHVHFRDGEVLEDVVPDTARRFARAIVMPNLTPPVTTLSRALAYRDRILDAVPAGIRFEPLMTLYLTDDTSPEEIERAGDSSVVHAVKLYPAGATTNSASGVTDIRRVHRVLEAMQRTRLPLLVHGEVTAPSVDVFDRESCFVDQVLAPLVDCFPELPVVVEHVSTRDAVQFVLDAGPRVAATITAHHLLLNRNALFAGGVRTHHYCLPVLKREVHRLALVAAATGGSPKFFLGTDSAPHPRHLKEAECGCAGIYTAHAAIELYAEVFEAAGALDRLEDFAARFGPRFYGLPINDTTVRLEREPWVVAGEMRMGRDSVVPLRAGEPVAWRLAA